MRITPLAERVAGYLFGNPFAKYIPLHKDDVDSDSLKSIAHHKLPYYTLGSGIPLENREKFALPIVERTAS